MRWSKCRIFCWIKVGKIGGKTSLEVRGKKKIG